MNGDWVKLASKKRWKNYYIDHCISIKMNNWYQLEKFADRLIFVKSIDSFRKILLSIQFMKKFNMNSKLEK
jgi:hypothetical protein